MAGPAPLRGGFLRIADHVQEHAAQALPVGQPLEFVRGRTPPTPVD